MQNGTMEQRLLGLRRESLLRALKKLHKCDIYHLNHKTENKKLFGVPNPSESKYNDIPDLKEVPCYWYNIQETLPDTDDSHPNRDFYSVYGVIFTQDFDVRLNDKAIYDGDIYYFKKPLKLHNVAWDVIAVREAHA